MKHKTKSNRLTGIKKTMLNTIVLCIMTSLLLLMDTTIYAQSDPRVSADDHPLAEAIGRFRSNGLNGWNQEVCTAWIAQGGVLVTAAHCNVDAGDVLEFNVPDSEGNGHLILAEPKDRYVVSQIIAKADKKSNGRYENGDDWLIFEVEDNPITGYQPIEAQLTYINLLKTDVKATSIPTLRIIGYGRDDYPQGSTVTTDYKNSQNRTLQTVYGDNETVSSTAGTILIEDGIGIDIGDSGAPVIIENTKDAIGVLNGKGTDDSGNIVIKGTSLHRSEFWTSFQNTQNIFNLTVNQKDESGSVLSGSTISRWNVWDEEFNDNILSGSSLYIDSVYEGNAEVFRGDQSVHNNPNEKLIVGLQDHRI